MDEILTKKLLSLNTRLLPNPPPITETTTTIIDNASSSIISSSNGTDICYQNPIVYCEDLYFGMRGVVGSWFLSPRRIIIETIIVLVISFFFIRCVQIKPSWKLSNSKYQHNSLSSSSKPNSSSTSTPTSTSLRPPKVMRIATAITFTLQVIYKLCGYPGKILVMVMPCNILWILNTILCYYDYTATNVNVNGDTNGDTSTSMMYKRVSSYSNLANTIIQLQCSYIALVFVALSSPDFSDTVLYGEVYFFYAHHFFLLYYVLHYVFITDQISTIDVFRNGICNGVKSFIQWILLSCSYFATFYFGIVTPLSIGSGLNLNYMLHPPPNQNDLVGQGYRITSIMYCTISFTVMRVSVMIMEYCWKKVCFMILGRTSLISMSVDVKVDINEKMNMDDTCNDIAKYSHDNANRLGVENKKNK